TQPKISPSWIQPPFRQSRRGRAAVGEQVPPGTKEYGCVAPTRTVSASALSHTFYSHLPPNPLSSPHETLENPVHRAHRCTIHFPTSRPGTSTAGQTHQARPALSLESPRQEQRGLFAGQYPFVARIRLSLAGGDGIRLHQFPNRCFRNGHRQSQ